MQANGMELTQEMTSMCNNKKRPTTTNIGHLADANK